MAEGGMVYTWSETGSDHRHRGLYSHYSRNYVESVSIEICTIMTRLGYGEEIRRWRVEKYREHDRLVNTLYSSTFITVGSKGEGLTGIFESDRDVLDVKKGLLCVEADINLDAIPDGIDVFRMDTLVYPGHCRLFQEGPVNNSLEDIFCSALCDNGYGDVLLSSCLWLDYRSKNSHPYSFYGEPVGPSIPMTYLTIGHMDTVDALPCHCPSILRRWAARPRHWPSSVLVQKVVSLGAYVTPVGYKGSDYKHVEWRICFNTGEAELVNNLNETQVKVYVILKMILKDTMKPTNKQITSYVLKNIILWQAENTQLYWLHDALRELRTAIETKQLSYYMIPERNLMAACGLEDALQRRWVANITDMMDEGPRVILRIEKIRKAIVASPEPMLWLSQKRMELEMLLLEHSNRWLQHNLENMEFDLSSSLNFKSPLFTRMLLAVLEVTQRINQEGRLEIGVVDMMKGLLML